MLHTTQTKLMSLPPLHIQLVSDIRPDNAKIKKTGGGSYAQYDEEVDQTFVVQRK